MPGIEARADADVRLVVDEEVAVDRVEGRLVDRHVLPLQRVFDQVARAMADAVAELGVGRRPRSRGAAAPRRASREGPARVSASVPSRSKTRRGADHERRLSRRLRLGKSRRRPSWSSTWRMLRRGAAPAGPVRNGMSDELEAPRRGGRARLRGGRHAARPRQRVDSGAFRARCSASASPAGLSVVGVPTSEADRRRSRGRSAFRSPRSTRRRSSTSTSTAPTRSGPRSR